MSAIDVLGHDTANCVLVKLIIDTNRILNHDLSCPSVALHFRLHGPDCKRAAFSHVYYALIRFLDPRRFDKIAKLGSCVANDVLDCVLCCVCYRLNVAIIFHVL